MLRNKTLELLEFAADAGYDEIFINERFGEYVRLRANNSVDEFEDHLEAHSNQFLDFLDDPTNDRAHPSTSNSFQSDFLSSAFQSGRR